MVVDRINLKAVAVFKTKNVRKFGVHGAKTAKVACEGRARRIRWDSLGHQG